jgi:hypothetical protein
VRPASTLRLRSTSSVESVLWPPLGSGKTVPVKQPADEPCNCAPQGSRSQVAKALAPQPLVVAPGPDRPKLRSSCAGRLRRRI